MPYCAHSLLGKYYNYMLHILISSLIPHMISLTHIIQLSYLVFYHMIITIRIQLKSLLSCNIFQADEDISEDVKKSHHIFAWHF